jgi:cell filamentation protein
MAVTPDTYPSSSVFVNKLDLQNPKALSKAEAEITMLRTEEYRSHPIDGNFDLEHLQNIHRFLFRDIYSWAGEPRAYNMCKDICKFTPHDKIEHYANQLYTELRNEHYLKDLSLSEVIERLAYYYDMSNRLHPFPEGNGRTQRLFIEHLAANVGYLVNWSLAHAWQINEVAIQSFSYNKEPTFYMFEDITSAMA